MTAQQKIGLLQVIQAIRQAVIESGSLGCPEGHVYAALMAQGCTIGQFEDIIALMVRTGAIQKKGNLLTVKGAK